MGGLIDIAARIMSGALRTTEVSAQNIANVTTPGYKRRIDFARTLAADQPAGATTPSASSVDFATGRLVQTENPYDLAIAGDGFFTVRTPAGELLCTRNGQFSRSAEGRLVDARGAVLQADGDDLVLRGGRFEVLADGVVLEDGEPAGRLDIVDIVDRSAATPADGGAFAAPEAAVQPADTAAVRQGAIEMSNVDTAAEMVAVMAALRRAETGQRLALVYDDLMGRAITTFGQST